MPLALLEACYSPHSKRFTRPARKMSLARSVLLAPLRVHHRTSLGVHYLTPLGVYYRTSFRVYYQTPLGVQCSLRP